MTETPELDLVLARDRLGLVDALDLLAASHATVDRGVITPSLAELITRRSSDSDLRLLFEDALHELEREVPSKEEATWYVARFYVRGIAQGAFPPREGMHQMLRDLMYRGQSALHSTHVVGDSHGLENLIGAYHDYYDLGLTFVNGIPEWHPSLDALKELDELVVSLANAWLSEHPA